MFVLGLVDATSSSRAALEWPVAFSMRRFEPFRASALVFLDAHRPGDADLDGNVDIVIGVDGGFDSDDDGGGRASDCRVATVISEVCWWLEIVNPG